MRKFYAAVFSILSFLTAYTQTTVQIGTGTEVPAATLYSPVYRFSATSATTGSRSNILFTAAEMGAAGIPAGATITKVEFNKVNVANFVTPATHQMLMGNTSNTVLTTATTWASILASHTQVFSSSSFNIPSAAGWVEWAITPFVYSGGSFEIATETSMVGSGGATDFFQWEFTTGAEDKIAGLANSTGGTLTGNVTAYKHRPNIRITFISGPCTDPATAGQAVSNAALSGVCPGTSVSLSLTGNSSGPGQTYKWQSSSTQFGTYIDISSEITTPSFGVNPFATTWYKAVVKCGPSGTPQTSAPVQVSVNPALPAGIYTIDNLQPTAGSNFQSFADAVNRLNCGITGHVIFEVSAGQSFGDALDISFQGGPSSTITFRKKGAGVNPKISRTGTSATTEFILKLSGADYLTFDGIDFEQTGTSATDWVEYGIFVVNASATNGSNNNTFKNGVISLSNANTAARGVFFDQVTTPTGMSGTNSNNKFLNMVVKNSFVGYYLTGQTNSFPDDGTEINTEGGGISRIENLGNGTAAASMYAVYCTYQSNLKLKNTQITNLLNGGTSLIYTTYLLTSTANSAEISGNTYSSISGGGVVTGIFVADAASVNIFNNKLFGIRSTTAAASAVRVIDLDATGLNANVYNNQIYDISSNGITGTTVGAIEVAAGLVFNIYNNMISDLRAPSSTSTAGSIKGIAVVGGTAGGVVRIYYNTVLLTDVGTAANYTSAGIYNSSTTPTLDIRNNIIVNRTDVSAGTRAVAFWKTSATVNIDPASDNNLYYAGVPGPKNLIFYDGTNSIQQLDDYKLLAGLSPAESNSLTENVVFLPVTLGIIRMDPNTQSLAESGGKEIAGYTIDFEGTQRGPYPLGGQLNGSGFKPDIGADEYDGRGLDILGPTIDFALLSNTASTTNRQLVVTITDPSGVRTGTNGPRLYYRKSGSSLYMVDQNPGISGDQYTFTFDYATLGGVIGGDVVEYYVAAQDMNGYGATSPFGGSGINPPGINAPAAPAIYSILYSVSGKYTVGTAGNYPNLTAIANLLNGSTMEVTGNIIFELQADYDGTTGETFPIQFNQFATSDSSWTVTIRPATGVTGRITSGDPGASSPLINLNGVDRLIIDGRPGGAGTTSEWTLRNTRSSAGTSGYAIRFINDAAYDTVQHLRLETESTSTTQGVVTLSTAASGFRGNSFNLIANNIISGRTDITPTTVATGIYSSGTADYPNSHNTFRNNHIINSASYGIYIAGNGNGADITIDGNHIYNDIATASTKYNIYLTADNTTNLRVINNFIGGSSPNAAGLMTVTGNVIVTGINVTGGIAKLNGNTIANITNTNTGATVRVRGIYNTSDKDSVQINQNTVHHLSSFGTVTGFGAGNQTVAGISVFPGSNAFYYITINDNIVHDLSAENTDPLTVSNMAVGFFLTNFEGVMARNRVYNINNKSTGTTPGQPPIAAGIYSRFLEQGYVVNNMISLGQGQNNNVQYDGVIIGANGNGNNHYYYNNTIYIGGTSTGDFSSFAFLRGDNSAISTVQGVNVRNNIFHMSRTGGTANNYAIGSQGPTPGTEWLSDYNDLYNSVGSNIGYWNSTAYDLAGWRVASAQDANSKVVLADFVNPLIADLHLTGSSVGNVQLGGVVIPVVTTDFDLQARNSIRPYMGADEAAIGLPVKLEYFKGVRQNNVHVLIWKGQCTGDDNRFIVERSSNGKDFTAIGEVSASRADCDFVLGLTDRTPLNGINYYRLKIKDENGRISYSIIIAILNKENGFEIVSVFPTLTESKLHVNVTSSKNLTLNLSFTDANGRTIQRTAKAVQQGSSLITLDVNNLAAGTYLLQCITADGYEKTVRFVKQ